MTEPTILSIGERNPQTGREIEQGTAPDQEVWRYSVEAF